MGFEFGDGGHSCVSFKYAATRAGAKGTLARPRVTLAMGKNNKVALVQKPTSVGSLGQRVLIIIKG